MVTDNWKYIPQPKSEYWNVKSLEFIHLYNFKVTGEIEAVLYQTEQYETIDWYCSKWCEKMSSLGKVHKARVKQPDHLTNVYLKWEFRIMSIKSVDYQINGVRWTMTSFPIFTVLNGKWLATHWVHMNTALSFSVLSYFSLYSLPSYISFTFSYAFNLNTAVQYISRSQSFRQDKFTL